jgi:hypothetical protein
MRRTFGAADAEMVTFFKTQLEDYKQKILKLYQERTTIMAERESARFKYISAWKSRLERAVGALQQEAGFNNQFAYVLNTLFDAVLRNIPMAMPNGSLVLVNGSMKYGSPISYLGLTDSGIAISYLAPSDILLNYKPANYDLPVYKLYTESLISQQPLAMLNQVWLYTVMINPETSQWEPLSFPMPLEWMKMFVKIQVGQDDEIVNSVMALLNKDTGQGSFNSIMSDGYSLALDVTDKTSKMIHLQLLVDEAIANLESFVAEFKSYGVDTPSIDEIFKSLNEAPALAPQVNTMLTQEVVLPPPVTEKSKLPLLAALAAGAVLLLKK